MLGDQKLSTIGSIDENFLDNAFIAINKDEITRSYIQYIEEHLEYLELEGFKIEKEITISSVQLQLDLSI